MPAATRSSHERGGDRLAIDPGDVREQAYLAALGAKLSLTQNLTALLEGRIDATLPAPADPTRASA